MVPGLAPWLSTRLQILHTLLLILAVYNLAGNISRLSQADTLFVNHHFFHLILDADFLPSFKPDKGKKYIEFFVSR